MLSTLFLLFTIVFAIAAAILAVCLTVDLLSLFFESNVFLDKLSESLLPVSDFVIVSVLTLGGITGLITVINSMFF